MRFELTPRSDNNSVLNLITSALEEQIKTKITEDFVAESLADYEIKLRENIADIIASISLDHIRTFKDAMHLRDEIIMKVTVNDKESEAVLEKEYT